MKNLPVHKGLLWKEYKENIRLFLLAFIIMSWDNMLRPLGNYLFYLLKGNTESWGTYCQQWSMHLQWGLGQNSHGLETTGVAIAVIAGIVLLSHERNQSLDYLLSTPVSRREIIVNKFIAGTAGLLLIMAVNTIFILIVLQYLPAVFVSSRDVLLWASVSTAAFIAIFAIGLLAATLAGHFIYAALTALVLMGLPHWLVLWIWSNYSIYVKHINVIYHMDTYLNLASYLTPVTYVFREGREDVISIPAEVYYGAAVADFPSSFLAEAAILLVAALLILYMAVKLFELNHLERKSEPLMFGNFKHIGQIVLAFIIASGYATEAESLGNYILYLLLGFVLAYIIIGLILRLVNILGVNSLLYRNKGV